jgi:sigma-B regulation protein RsbU (phosphoserine phosphatase)
MPAEPAPDLPAPFPHSPAASASSGAVPERFLQRLRQAIDEHAIVAMTDARGVIVYANDRFCTISGYAREELLGRTHRIVNSGHHPPEFWQDFWATISAGRTWHGVVCNRRKDGSIYWVDTTVLPVPGEDGRPQYYLSLRTEITRLKQVEEELGALTRDLERRVEERTAQLQRSEQLYRTLLASVTDYHYTVAVRDGRAVHTTHTPTCLAVTGYSEEDFTRDPDLWLKMVPPEDRPAVIAHAEAALAGRPLAPLEHRIIRADGEVRWIRDTIVVRRDAQGQVVVYDGIITDITAEKEAQSQVRQLNQQLERRVVERTAQLAAAHQQLTLLFENAPIGISWVEWRGEREIYHLNDRFCSIIGLSRKEAEDFENIIAATHPDDRPRQLLEMERLRRGATDSFSLLKRYVHRDGRTVWAVLTVVVLRDAHGRITQQFAMLEDVTERRRAEEDLRRSELRFRRYVENASEILYALTPEGIFTFVSPSWTDKLGHRREQVVGHDIAEFVHPDDVPSFREFLATTIARGASARAVEYRALHQDGTARWHASSGSTMRDETGTTLFLGVGRDITLRKEAQEKLSAALAQREELERIIDRSPSVVVLWRAEEGFPVEFVSRSVEQFGWPREAFLDGTKRFIDLVHPEDAPRVSAEVTAHAIAGDREYTQEYRIVTRDGNIRWIDDRTFIRAGPDGRITHHEGILSDITERKESEARELAARERDLQVARDVQHHLLPSIYPDITETEIGALYVPSRVVGGDYYDFFPVDERRWGFAVADVSGKGAAAALMMAACRTTLRLTAAGGYAPLQVLREVNRHIQPDMPQGMFISMVYGILDLDSKEFRFARAGHEPPLVLRRRLETALTLCPAGLALGLDAGPLFDSCLEEARVALEPGDLLVLYTDGITETVNATALEFGRHRLEAVLRGVQDRPMAEVKHAVNRAIDEFAAVDAPVDDRTLLIVRPR